MAEELRDVPEVVDGATAAAEYERKVAAAVAEGTPEVGDPGGMRAACEKEFSEKVLEPLRPALADQGCTLLDPKDRREITSHKVNGLNERLSIFALDPPGPGGASHEYVVRVPLSPTMNAATSVKFQKGPIAEAGVNGLSNEALLAIVEDRLNGFQLGPYACPWNQTALYLIQAAMDALKQRTQERTARGVGGTSQL